MLAGCNRTDYASNPREKLALAGAAGLREAFNRGACRQIFDDADEVFRVSQTDWLDVCERMLKRLGWWRSFHTQLRRTDGVPIRVVVYGEAEFAKGRYQVETVWHFDRGRAELFSLILQGGGEQIQIPPLRFGVPRRLMDPPAADQGVRTTSKCPGDFVRVRPDMSGPYIAAIVGSRHLTWGVSVADRGC